MPTEHPSRHRLFSSARKLFAEYGYENTSTSSIAREAGTSESQLIKHFGGKAGLLESIFVDGWSALRPWFDERLQPITSPVERLRTIPRLMAEALRNDPELRLLLLLEGRRIRKEGGQAHLMDGFRGVVELIDRTIAEVVARGEILEGVSPESIRAALLGLTEGAMRDQLLAERAGRPAAITMEQIGTLGDALVDSIRIHTHTGAGGR
jgi:AcrR family transcriptional regulator